MMGEDTYRAWWSEETFRGPTAAEIAECPLPAWMERGELDHERTLVGARS
jgi:hypothetical protein